MPPPTRASTPAPARTEPAAEKPRDVNVSGTATPVPAKVYLPRRRHSTKRLNLALQGGGAHGAFTWGVLDRFLELGEHRIDGISGTSAGAVNAVCVAAGLMEGRATSWKAYGVRSTHRTAAIRRSPNPSAATAVPRRPRIRHRRTSS